MSLRGALSLGRSLVQRRLPLRAAAGAHSAGSHADHAHGDHGHAEHGHGDHGHGHDDHHIPEWERHHLEMLKKSPPGWEPPNGFLFGEKPGPREKWEWWEGPWYFGYYLPLGIFLVLYFTLPENSKRASARLVALERIAELDKQVQEDTAFAAAVAAAKR